GDGAFGHLRRDAHGLTVLARRAAFACFCAATAAPTAPLAAVTVGFAFTGRVLAGRFVGQPFGFLGFDLGLDVERLFIVIGLLGLRRRRRRRLGRQQGFRGFQRMHLLTAIDDVG